MIGERIAAGYVSLLAEAIQRCYPLSASELMRAAQLEGVELADADASVPLGAFHDLFRFALDQTGDPGLGVRIASAIDLRTQGFWGYALMSSTNMRERIERHLRYQPLRFPCDVAFWVEGDRGVVELAPRATPAELVPIVLDWALACACIQMGRNLGTAPPAVSLWLRHAERPHHSALRALVAGEVHFHAPYNRICFAARDLDMRLAGDPHLGKLAVNQLEQQLALQRDPAHDDLLTRVRQRLRVRLARDPSLSRIARDLRVSERTLRRQLSGLGVSFHRLLDEERCSQALAALREGDSSIDEIAAQLGYSEAANFRRAFRRWTGVAPSAFRLAQRPALHGATANDPLLVSTASAPEEE